MTTETTETTAAPVLALSHISKRFGPIVANDDISIALGYTGVPPGGSAPAASHAPQA